MSDRGNSARGRKRTLTDSARKRNRKDAQAAYQKSKIHIGDEIDRWNDLKDLLRLESHTQVAKLLLDRYAIQDRNISPRKRSNLEDNEVFKTPTHTAPSTSMKSATPDHKATTPSKKTKYEEFKTPSNVAQSSPSMSYATPDPKALTSTPGPLADNIQPMSDMSRISSSESERQADDSDTHISGIEELPSRRRSHLKESSSFINPFELTIDITEVKSNNSDSDDEDYEPSLNISFGEADDTRNIVEEDEEDEIDDDELEQTDFYSGPGVKRIDSDEEVHDFLADHPCLAFYSQLLNLAMTSIQKICSVKGCGLEVDIQKEVVASAIYLKWVCQNGHIAHKWCSQPILNRGMHSGDMMIAASVVLSGSNFQKISMFARYLKLPILSKSTFFKIQRHYVIPSVDEYWIDHQDAILNSFRGQDLVILGDGRMDSPGHSAQYCSYTFMENISKQILCIVTMDKRMTEKKSTNLEKACFLKCLKFLLDKGLNITEVVTDAHVQIASIMKKDYPDVKHSWDVWHGTKNLGKKIIKAGQDKKCKELLEWTKDVVNHFWYTAQTCNTKEEFMGMWIGVLHHVVDEHEWIFAYSTNNKCEHGPLSSERDKGWLKKDSPAHCALRDIVLNKRLINNIPHYTNFRSTAELENFQNLILMYASKRHSYRPPTYRCRNLLAALDHNGHIGRPILTNKDGSVRYQRVFQKKSSRWSVTPCKTLKDYAYIPQVIEKIVMKRLADEIGMNQRMILEIDDPRRVSAHLAPVPPPPTQQIVESQRSRFTDESSNRTNDDMDRTIDYWAE